MSLAQALQHMLKAKLVTLKDPPQKPNTSSSRHNPNVRCMYHSNSPRHDTDSCWELKHKIHDLIDKGVFKFTQDGQIEFFYYPSNIEAARHTI